MIQWHFAKRSIFTGKVAWNSHLTHGLRHNCVIDQSATENKLIYTLIIDFFSHGLRSVKIEQELEKYDIMNTLYTLLFKYMIKCIKHGTIRIICRISLHQYHPSGLKALWMILVSRDDTAYDTYFAMYYSQYITILKTSVYICEFGS